MPRTGGESDKLGNRYEGLWTVHNLIDVLAGDAVALQPEAYEEPIGVEFLKTLKDGSEEFHSVKRQRAGSGWTLSALVRLDQRGRSVLTDLFDKLNSSTRREVVFVSTTVHSQTNEIWDRSRRCNTPEEFKRQMETDKALHEDFTKYVLPLCAGDLDVALKRLHSLSLVSLSDDSNLVDRCIRALSQNEFMEQRSAQVAGLLRRHRKRDDAWKRRVKWMFHFGHVHHSQEMFDFFLELIEEGLFDDLDNLRWHSLAEMAKERPAYAVEFLARVLTRMISQAGERGATNPFENGRNRQIESRYIITTSKSAPKEFVERIVPIIKDLVLANAQPAK